MNIYFFCEVNEDKKPKFYNLFQTNLRNADKNTVFIISSEYASDLKNADNVYVLSKEILEDIERNLSGSEKRENLLSICRVPSLEIMINSIIKKDEFNLFFTNGVYCSICHLEEKKQIINYVIADYMMESVGDIAVYQGKIEELSIKIKEQQEHIKFAQECMQVRELQLLESENRKAELEEILKNNNVDYLQEEIKKLEREAQTYYDMYMKSMVEINSLKETILTLRKKYEKKSS